MGMRTQGWTGVLVGLLVGASAPAVAADPPAVLIFFDSGKPVLTRDATEALAEAFRNALPGARWSVRGHADRSGPVGANLKMALARARAARDYLVQLGADATAISVSSSGEEAPLIATGDGVWEPQNRRVEIRLDR